MSQIPLFDFDVDPEDLLSGYMAGEYPHLRLPSRAVMAILGNTVDGFVRTHECEVIETFDVIMKDFPIYRVKKGDVEIALVAGPVGASMAVLLAEFMFMYGVEKMIATGSCGALHPYPEGELLIATKALRDEGTSYAYLPASPWVDLDPELSTTLRRLVTNAGAPVTDCVTWTTDAPMRETKQRIQLRKDQGCDVVEMECASLAACAQFRGKQFAQLLFTADTLADVNNYDARDFGRGVRGLVLSLSLDAIAAA